MDDLTDGNTLCAGGDGSQGRQRSRRYPGPPTALGNVYRPLYVVPSLGTPTFLNTSLGQC